MTERKMTEKGFLRKATGKVSAAGFIAQHREWLTTGTLGSMTQPILAKLDSGEMMPTPALIEINQAVLDHLIAKDIVRGEAVINAGPRVIKPYSATVYNAQGQVCTYKTEDGQVKDMVYNFDESLKAEGWCDRRLDAQGPGCYAIILDNASGRTQRIERDTSIARLYGGRKPSPIMKETKGSSTLGWKMKAKGDIFHFSKG